MGIPFWLAIGIGLAVFAVWYSYLRRVEAIIRKYDGFRLGFAGLNMAFGFHWLNREHPHYPAAMDAELQGLAMHRLVLLAVLAMFAVIVAVGMVFKLTA